MSETLYIIDGYSQFFRAYYARRPYQTSPVTGEPTKLVAGFADILMSLIRNESPTWLAVALDVSGDKGTFRSQIDAEYKGNREKAPEDFGPQVDRCFQMLDLLDIPMIGIEGVEADDVIATIAKRISGQTGDVNVRIISSDKDLTQVINDKVELFDPSKGVRTPSDVFKFEGVEPHHVLDILSLMGDSVDNIPGIPGIGPKTAAKLILQYGNIEGIYEHIDEMTPKRRENLEGGFERLEMNRKLVRLQDTLDFDFPIESARIEPASLDLPSLETFCREMGFTRLPAQVRDLITSSLPVGEDADPDAFGTLWAESTQSGAVRQADPEAEYQLVDTLPALRKLVGSIRSAGRVSFDVETTGLDVMREDLCGIAISHEPGKAFYIPVRSPSTDDHLDESTVVQEMRDVLEDPAIVKIAHNAKFDIKMLRRVGINVTGQVKDTMIASYVVNSTRSRHRMDDLALGLLGLNCIPISSLIGSGSNQKTFDTVDLDIAVPYAAEDADITLRLWDVLDPDVRRLGLVDLLDEVELPLVPVLAEMEYTGIRVDPDELDRQRLRLEDELARLRKQILDCAPGPLNPDSPKQLAAALFNDPEADPPGMGLTPVKKRKTGPSTDQEVLEKLDRDPEVMTPLPGLVLEYRQLAKLVSTYLLSLKDSINPRTHRIHSKFNQVGTATGRLSSNDPNLQNIPIRTETGREIRRAFIPEEGFQFVTADYSQVELRLLAHLSGDEGMQSAFHAGEDIHRAVAAEVFGVPIDDVTKDQRSAAKMVNFGIVYGVTPYGLARRLDQDVARASRIISDYKNRFKGIETFLESCVQEAQEKGFVETMRGRRRQINDINSPNRQTRAMAERLAINSVVQGSAADLIKIAMIDVDAGLKEIDPGARLILQVHDELVLECPLESSQSVRDYLVERMESAMKLDVPMVVDASISSNWYDAK
ncbi:MAG: DNA polymerase I [Phycisphaerales bacterium]|nr:DNA polymerase I [Phycisphaerales bacterium]